ncbi:MAG: ATP-binding protein [Desulfovibrionales bacterium]
MITESQLSRNFQFCDHFKNLNGKDLQSLIPPTQTSDFFRCIGKVKKENTISSLEFSQERCGKEHFFEARFYPYHHDQIVTIVRDITERKIAERNFIREQRRLESEVEKQTRELTRTLQTLREAEERYRSVFENATEGIYIAHLDGSFREVNTAMARLLGYNSVSDLMQASLNKFDGFVDSKRLKEFLILLKQGRVRHFEYQVEQASGERIWVCESARLQTVSRDGRMVVEGIVQDISARKEKEEAEQRRVRAELANQAKDEFLSHISHEMRTPMQIISGIADLFRTTTLDSKQSRYVRLLKSSSEMMTRFVNDLLDFSRLEAGKLHLESRPFSLCRFAEEIVQSLADRFHTKGLEFVCLIDCSLETRVLGDAHRVRQILYNLLTNAAKFTHSGEVVLSLSRSNGKEGAWIFSVRDTGIGIKKEDIDRVFDSFVQADSEIGKKYGGTGLGLSISQRLVSLMNGVIRVKSIPEKGSEFILEVPLPSDRKDDQFSSPRLHAEFKNSRILVVDDSEMARVAVEKTLAGWGALVRMASNQGEALRLLRSAREEDLPYHCILLDETLPGVQSHDVIEELRNGYPESSQRIVLMTSGESAEKNPFTQKRAGLVGNIAKPILPSELLELMKGLLPESVEAKSSHSTPRPFEILLIQPARSRNSVFQSFFQKTHHVLHTEEGVEGALRTIRKSRLDYIFLDFPEAEEGFTIAEQIREMEQKEQPGNFPFPIIMVLDVDTEADMGRCLRSGCSSFLMRPVGQSDILDVLERYLPE